MAKYVYKKVNQLIKKYDTNCPFKLAKNLGIEIIYEDLGSTRGYFNKVFNIKMIHINEDSNEKDRQFICAHELGHAVLHPNANTPFLKKHTFFVTDRIEFEANIFAMSLIQQQDYSFLAEDSLLFEEIDDIKLTKLVTHHLGRIKNS